MINEQIILNNLNIVDQEANKYRYLPFIQFEDLEGYGIIGLIKAVQRYDESKGVPFGCYARIRIKGEIIEGLRHNGLQARYNRKKTSDGYKYNFPIYIADLIKQSNKTEEEYPNFNWEAPFQKIENDIDYQLIKKTLLTLSSREQHMIKMRFFDEMLYKDIGLVYNVNESRVYQIINKALRKIKNKINKGEICC